MERAVTRTDNDLPPTIPDRTQWRTLQPPVPTPVLQVAELLDDGLPPGWTVALRPRIGNSQPDVVALNPDVGVAVYEINDWNQDNLEMAYSSGEAALTVRRPGDGWYLSRNPIGQLYGHRDAVKELFDPFEPGRGFVTAVVVMAGYPTKDAQAALKYMIRADDRTRGHCNFVRIVGREPLEAGNVETLLPAAFNPALHRPIGADAVARLGTQLTATGRARTRGDLFKLDSRKREILKNPEGVKLRRIKGAAGTGKSALLAGAAVKAALEGRKVLLVCYNIALRLYLRDLISRICFDRVGTDDAHKAVRDNVTVMYLHEWCKQVCRDTGLEKQLRLQIAEAINFGFSFPTEEIKSLVEEGIGTRQWPVERGTTVTLYDTVLIDEAQNIDADWFALLRGVLRDSESELLLTADPTQSLYPDEPSWTDEKMKGAGFRGPWIHLTGSYRLPTNLIPMAVDFCERFFSDRTDTDAPVPDTEQQQDLLCTLRYRNVLGSQHLAGAVAELTHRAPDLLGVRRADMSFIVPKHLTGLNVLEHLKGLDPEWTDLTRHVFSQGFPGRQRLKFAFFPDPDRAQGSTMHSFQGWETRCLVIGIPALEDDGCGDPDNAYARDYWTSIYIGLTRLAISQAGSHLIVVNGEPRLENFLSAWFEPI